MITRIMFTASKDQQLDNKSEVAMATAALYF